MISPQFLEYFLSTFLLSLLFPHCDDCDMMIQGKILKLKVEPNLVCELATFLLSAKSTPSEEALSAILIQKHPRGQGECTSHVAAPSAFLPPTLRQTSVLHLDGNFCETVSVRSMLAGF